MNGTYNIHDIKNLRVSNLIVIYDGDCGFCEACVDYWKKRAKEPIDFYPSQQLMNEFSYIPKTQYQKSVVLIFPNLSYSVGAKAAFQLFSKTTSYGKILIYLYEHFFLFRKSSEWIYKKISENRMAISLLLNRFLNKKIKICSLPKKK